MEIVWAIAWLWATHVTFLSFCSLSVFASAPRASWTGSRFRGLHPQIHSLTNLVIVQCHFEGMNLHVLIGEHTEQDLQFCITGWRTEEGTYKLAQELNHGFNFVGRKGEIRDGCVGEVVGLDQYIFCRDYQHLILETWVIYSWKSHVF